MGKVLILLLVLCFAAKIKCGRNKCVEEAIQEIDVETCDQTEYESYVDCMRKRAKRSAECDDECEGDDCSDDCSDCDCDYCSQNDCGSSCTSCCQPIISTCSTRSCCRQSCHSTCRTTSCRRKCKSDCVSKIGSSSNQISQKTESKNEARHNITTIINLHNMINNTNIVDIPVNVNNTNINNITIEAESSAPQVISQVVQQKEQQNCCKIIGPRQCTQTDKYPYMKCFHYRKEHCGDLCQNSIMHAEPHQVCDQLSTGGQSCHQQVAYIPQPKPRCSYTSSWPYVSCGIGNPNVNCGGCYSHLIEGGTPPDHCSSSCYDGGYDQGQLFRQGPFFQPSYSPYPPCTYTGTCGQFGGAYGQQIFPNAYPPQNPLDSGYQVELLTGSPPYNIDDYKNKKRETPNDSKEEDDEDNFNTLQ